MSTPKYNKFNTGRTKNYFPLKRWRINTDEHPVVKSKEKCASSTAKTLYSIQELQMLVGLTNTLQCNEREAVRIALYEASRNGEKAYEMAFAGAASQSTEKAHQGRSLLKQWKLPKQEKERAAQAAKDLRITDKEFLRLSIIWLQRGIRDDRIKELSNCKLIPFDTEAKKWSRENPGSEAQGRTPHPGVAKLKRAASAAYERAGEIYRQRNKAKWAMRKAYLMENGFVIAPDEEEQQRLSSIDALIEIQEADNFQRFVNAEIEKLRLHEREAFELRWLKEIPDLTCKEIDVLWEQELAEAKEIAESDEQIDELMEEVELMLEELHASYTPEEREEHERQRNDFNERFSKQIRRRSRRSVQYPSDPKLRKRLDEFFDALD